MDDLNLQYRMQQIGVMILIVPAVLGNASLITHQLKIVLSGGVGNGLHYLLLSTVNGFAFTSYNLASTYVLTRISVVHHAALNCIRRVFAIVITSIVFGLAITPLQIVGICTSVSGFFAYTHHKMKRAEKARKRKEMRRKYGVEMRPLKRSAKKDVESAV
jgi:drug/metabolite transporter (DMT)-like permease